MPTRLVVELDIAIGAQECDGCQHFDSVRSDCRLYGLGVKNRRPAECLAAERAAYRNPEAALAIAIEALRAIALFGHVESCDCKSAPVYECGCYAKSQWKLAQECLARLESE